MGRKGRESSRLATVHEVRSLATAVWSRRGERLWRPQKTRLVPSRPARGRLPRAARRLSASARSRAAMGVTRRGVASWTAALLVAAGCAVAGEFVFLFLASRSMTLLDVRIEGCVPAAMFARALCETATLLGGWTGVVVAARILRAGAMVDRVLLTACAQLVLWLAIDGIAVTLDEGCRAALCSCGLALVWVFVLGVMTDRTPRVGRAERVTPPAWAPISIASPPT